MKDRPISVQENLVALGKRLKERRQSQRKPAKEIAQAIGITPNYLWMIENAAHTAAGKPARPSTLVLNGLARVLGLDERELLALAGYSVASSSEEPPQQTIASGPPVPRDEVLLAVPPRWVERKSDLDWLIARLRTGGVCALYGLPGAGKSALAAVAVHRLRAEGRFTDGVVAFSLDGPTDVSGGELIRRILARFAPPASLPDSDAIAELAQAAQSLLCGRDTLVVLDDCDLEPPAGEPENACRGSAGQT